MEFCRSQQQLVPIVGDSQNVVGDDQIYDYGVSVDHHHHHHHRSVDDDYYDDGEADYYHEQQPPHNCEDNMTEFNVADPRFLLPPESVSFRNGDHLAHLNFMSGDNKKKNVTRLNTRAQSAIRENLMEALNYNSSDDEDNIGMGPLVGVPRSLTEAKPLVVMKNCPSLYGAEQNPVYGPIVPRPNAVAMYQRLDKKTKKAFKTALKEATARQHWYPCMSHNIFTQFAKHMSVGYAQTSEFVYTMPPTLLNLTEGEMVHPSLGQIVSVTIRCVGKNQLANVYESPLFCVEIRDNHGNVQHLTRSAGLPTNFSKPIGYDESKRYGPTGPYGQSLAVCSSGGNNQYHSPQNLRGETLPKHQLRGMWYDDIKRVVVEPRQKQANRTVSLTGLKIGSKFFFLVGTSYEAYLIDPLSTLTAKQTIENSVFGCCWSKRDNVDRKRNFSISCIEYVILLLRGEIGVEGGEALDVKELETFFTNTGKTIVFSAGIGYTNNNNNTNDGDGEQQQQQRRRRVVLSMGLTVVMSVVAIAPKPHPSNYAWSYMPQHAYSVDKNYDSSLVRGQEALLSCIVGEAERTTTTTTTQSTTNPPLSFLEERDLMKNTFKMSDHMMLKRCVYDEQDYKNEGDVFHRTPEANLLNFDTKNEMMRDNLTPRHRLEIIKQEFKSLIFYDLYKRDKLKSKCFVEPMTDKMCDGLNFYYLDKMGYCIAAEHWLVEDGLSEFTTVRRAGSTRNQQHPQRYHMVSPDIVQNQNIGDSILSSSLDVMPLTTGGNQINGDLACTPSVAYIASYLIAAKNGLGSSVKLHRALKGLDAKEFANLISRLQIVAGASAEAETDVMSSSSNIELEMLRRVCEQLAIDDSQGLVGEYGEKKKGVHNTDASTLKKYRREILKLPPIYANNTGVKKAKLSKRKRNVRYPTAPILAFDGTEDGKGVKPLPLVDEECEGAPSAHHPPTRQQQQQ